MALSQPFLTATKVHPSMSGCATCGCQVRRTAYWDVNGMPLEVMAAALRELDEQMGGECIIRNGGPLGEGQPGAWYTIIAKPDCNCEFVLHHRIVDVPRHPGDCSTCNYHERDLRCLVDLGVADESIASHLQVLRAHCRLEDVVE